MTQEQDARDDNKEGNAPLKVTPPKCPANERHVGLGEEAKNESKSGSKDPFDELFEELADGEIEGGEEGFQEIFGQGGAEVVTAVVDTPTSKVETSGGEAEEVEQESLEEISGEQEVERVEEKETNGRDPFAMEEEEEEQIETRRSEG